MIPELFTIAALWGLFCARLAVIRPWIVTLGLPSTILGFATAELARFHIAWQVVATAGWVALGALEEPIGWVGLGAAVLGWIGLEVAHRRGQQARALVRSALAERSIEMPVERAGDAPKRRPRFSTVDITRDLDYGPEARNRADLYVPIDVDRAPIVLQVHGGGWVSGNKAQQGQPLLAHFTRQGWIGVAINYRMGPSHRLPAALHDVKRAIAWIREHAADWGGDADRILVTGGSAGGHLTAMAALTIGDTSLQPGFEDADCSVAAAAPMYGVYDMTDQAGHRGRSRMEPFLDRMVMASRFRDDPDGWAAMSPIARLHPDVPPMFTVACRYDTLVPIAESRDFIEALASTSESAIAVELPYAHHAFDVIGGPRTHHVVEGLERWASHVVARGSVEA